MKTRAIWFVCALSVALLVAGGCATVTPNGVAINDVQIYAPGGAPAGCTSLGLITTADVSAGQWFATLFTGFAAWADFTPDYQKLAIGQATELGADALIQLDKRTYEAVQCR